MKNIFNKSLSSLLPNYVIGKLSIPEYYFVKCWLSFSPTARQQVEAWKMVRKAVQTQPFMSPSPEVFTKIRFRLRTASSQQKLQLTGPANFWQKWAWGMALVILSLTILWNVLPPGVVLQWSAQGGQPTRFRVYRAPQLTTAGDAFELVEEISADNGTTTYIYRDFLLLPGQNYVYRVEAVGQDGLSSSSQTIVSNAMEALPGQLTLLLSLLIIGYGLTQALQRPKWVPVQIV